MISVPLCELINKYFALGIFPDICKMVKIVSQEIIATTKDQSHFTPA